MGLFRPEALAANARSTMGEVLIVQPPLFAIMSFAAVIVSLAAISLLVFGEFSRKETVSGYLAPREGVAAVVAARGGVVTGVFVGEGDVVAEGDLLVSLSTDSISGEGVGTLSAQLAELRTRIREQRLQADMNSARLAAETARTQDRIAAVAADIQRLERRTALTAESLALAQDQWRRWQRIGERGIAAAGELDARRQELISAQVAAAEIERLVAERHAELGDLRHSAVLLSLEAELAESRARADIAVLEQSHRELLGAIGYTLAAPVAGRVTSVQATVGLPARPDQPLAAILPTGTRLWAHLFTPTRAAGFVEAGQPVHLRIDAFPYQRFGALDGYISEVSRAVLSPMEIAGPIAVTEPVYRLGVELEIQRMNAYGTAQALQSGMTLQADVIVDRRPLWRWFIDPVQAVRGH
ncbi:MAG: HlyD family efflux transporter periplasmic adaptor subunit [Gammaproteobacteria bacterium]|nr:HlyD family efflux transporter periplasmic adaptor subunit [Gammaproteobacteria bacterium]